MLSFRHHLLSLIAVFLSLAVGIVLGSYVFGTSSGANESDTATDTAASDAAQLADYGDGIAARLGVGGQRVSLGNTATVVLALPGADPTVVRAVRERINAAGGNVTGSIELSMNIVGQNKEQLLDSLTAQLLQRRDIADTGVSAELPTHERAGALLGSAITGERGESITSPGKSVLDSLGSADFIKIGQQLNTAAPTMVVVAGDQAAAKAATVGFVQGLTNASAPVTVAGTVQSAEDGQLANIRGSDVSGRVITVDGVDRTMGLLSLQWALANGEVKPGQHFGPVGADGVPPLQ